MAIHLVFIFNVFFIAWPKWFAFNDNCCPTKLHLFAIVDRTTYICSHGVLLGDTFSLINVSGTVVMGLSFGIMQEHNVGVFE